jgi:photosystem II stability/assembly factor-like uncharacterized protein
LQVRSLAWHCSGASADDDAGSVRSSHLLALSFALSAGISSANGRFPRAQRLIEHPLDPDTLALSATYGVLLSSGRGQHWAHICESAYAFGIYESDRPLLEWLDDGRLLAGTFASLNATTDWGCNFRTLLGGTDAQGVPDMSVEADGTIIALRSESLAEGGSVTGLVESTDRGETWVSLAEGLEIGAALTLDSAPSDNNRLYVTGLGGTGTGVILRSDDRGRNFEVFDIPGTGFNDTPYIAAVDPSDPNKVFVRTDSVAEMDDGLPWANDALLLSEDGGQSWQEMIRLPVKLYGFALVPDGQSVLLGYGTPNDLTEVDGRAVGIYKLSLSATGVERIFGASVSCLRWTPTGLYVCTSQAEVGYELGFAQSADFTLADEAPLTPLLVAPQVQSLTCAARRSRCSAPMATRPAASAGRRTSRTSSCS